MARGGQGWLGVADQGWLSIPWSSKAYDFSLQNDRAQKVMNFKQTRSFHDDKFG